MPEGAAAVGTLVFRAKDVAANTNTLVRISGGTAVSTEGLAGNVPEASCSLLVRNNAAYDPAHALLLPGTAAARVGTATTLPVAVRIDAPLDGAQWTVTGSFDAALLDVTGATAAANSAWSIIGTSGFLPPNGATTLATLVFDALDVEEDTTAFVEVATASAASAEALPATVRKASSIVVTIHNNPAYDPVHATFLPGTASAKIGTEAALPVAVQIDAALDGAAWAVSGTYDTSLLDVLGTVASAPGMTLECTAEDGAFTVRGTGGTLASMTAAQPLFALRVRPAVQYAVLGISNR